MSSSSSHATEMVSISSGNSAAETDVSDINERYAAINDTAPPRKRRLPMPPALKPARPKKNTLCHQLCKELCSYCVGSRLILSIPLLVLTLAALGVLIYQLVTNIPVREPPTTTTVLPTEKPEDAGCPCESDYELNSGTELKCELKVIGNTTISFDKVSGENILYQTGIRIPDNVRESGRFSAMWNRSGTLTTRIKFSPVRCPDEGNYSLTVTSRKGTQRQYMYVKVIDHPNEPTISTLKGLINGIENVLQCQASTGCKNASLILETTEGKGNYYIPWDGNLTSIHVQEGYIWKTNATLNLTPYMVDIGLKNRCLRCTYSIGDKPYYSKPICIKSIEADFCITRNRKFDCEYPHPYDCNKSIKCVKSGPVESFCQPGLHYHQKVDNCTGECDYPSKANCNIRLFDGCDCHDV